MRFKELMPLLEIKFGDMLMVIGDSIIKVKSEEVFDNYTIIFDGECYYLLDSKGSFINKSKIKDNLIPEGVAKVV